MKASKKENGQGAVPCGSGNTHKGESTKFEMLTGYLLGMFWRGFKPQRDGWVPTLIFCYWD